MGTYQFKKLNSKDYINQLYTDGLQHATYLNDVDIEQLVCEMGIFKFKGYVRAFKSQLKNYNIEDILFLYFFDRFLSKELLTLCLTFESKLKSILVEESYKLINNPFFYLEKSNYINDKFKLKNEIFESWKNRNYPNNEDYTHYHQYYLHTYSFSKNYDKYLKSKILLSPINDMINNQLTLNTNFPPFHYLTESSTFGIIKSFINNLTLDNNKLLSIIAKKFGFYQDKKFHSYIERINEIRNRCAHNGRIFNRTYRSVTAIGKYKSFRNDNLSVHSVVDVYMTLYFLLNRLDAYSTFDEFYHIVIENLFTCFISDFESNMVSKNLISNYTSDEFSNIKMFIIKGMGIKKLNVQAAVQRK